MFEKLFGEGAVLGVETAIPLKYGISLDLTYYGILFIKAVNNSMPIMANSVFNFNSIYNEMIVLLIILGFFVLVVTLYDAYQKIQDDWIGNGCPYVFGFICGLCLIIFA